MVGVSGSLAERRLFEGFGEIFGASDCSVWNSWAQLGSALLGL